MNLKAELEIRALHDKLDALREAQWAALVALQHEQIEQLRGIVAQRAAPVPNAIA